MILNDRACCIDTWVAWRRTSGPAKIKALSEDFAMPSIAILTRIA